MGLFFTNDIDEAKKLRSKNIPLFFTRFREPLLETTNSNSATQHIIGRRYKGCLSEFDGSFVNLLIKKDITYIDRDSYGSIPIYFSNKIQFVTTELDIIIKLLKPKPSSVDISAMSEYLSASYITGGKTLYKDISWLLPYQTLSFKKNKFSINNKKIFPKLHLSDEKKVSNYLDQSINNSLSDFVKRFPGPITINLSGGTDSTLLFAKIRELQPNKKIFTNTYFHADWRKDLNDWEYAELVSKKFKSEHKLINITNQKFCRNHFEYLKKIKHVSHTFASSFYLQNKSNSKLPILNGSGPDESIIGTEKISIKDLLNFKNLPKKFWNKNLIEEIDYLKLSEKNVQKYLLKKYRSKANFVNNRLSVASELKESKNFIEFQRRYHAVTVLQDHILEISQVGSVIAQPIIFPYLTQDIFNIIFSTPFEILNKNGVYKSIIKKLLERHINKNFVNRPKIGFQAPSRPYFAKKNGLGGSMNNLLKVNNSKFFDLVCLKDAVTDRIENNSNIFKRYDFLEWTSYNMLLLEKEIFNND
jgi:asparagine synthetase B (glutamine-hydrolysing)